MTAAVAPAVAVEGSAISGLDVALARLKAATGGRTAQALSFETALRDGPAKGVAKPADPAASVHRKFEAMVLSQLIAAMMNAGGESVFGEGTAMSTYSSLFADAIAQQIAARGGIGIAATLAGPPPPVVQPHQFDPL
ncbi:MAG: hypothetical protein BroJett030_01020 [Alphaproteobacteria bacterium]|nr:MAG: hypothetical protein BroJett030_01020 [Alphaproteobacteria bacterium]